MKKYFLKFTAVILLLGVITACEEKQVIYDGSPAVAGFATNFGQLNVLESTGGTTSIAVNISSLSSQDRVILIETNSASTATESQYQIDQASLIIPANQYTGYIKVSGNFEALPENGSVNLILDLQNFGGATADPSLSTFTLAIKRSCPFDVNAIGTDFTASPSVDGEAAPVYLPVMTKVANLPAYPDALATYTVDSLWGPDFVGWITSNSQYDGQYVYSGTIIINPDLTLVIKGDDSWATGGNGSYNPCDNTFTYTLANTLFQSPFETLVTFTPN